MRPCAPLLLCLTPCLPGSLVTFHIDTPLVASTLAGYISVEQVRNNVSSAPSASICVQYMLPLKYSPDSLGRNVPNIRWAAHCVFFSGSISTSVSSQRSSSPGTVSNSESTKAQGKKKTTHPTCFKRFSRDDPESWQNTCSYQGATSPSLRRTHLL